MDTKETKIYIALLTAAIILGVVFFLYIVTLIKQQKKNVALYKEKILAEITILENERKRFVSDLHDEIGPMLSTLKLYIGTMSSALSEDTVLHTKSLKLIADMLDTIHTIANNIMSNTLERKGIIVALNQFTDEINLSHKIKITVTAPDSEIRFDKEKEIHLYRILQETINNAIKHSNAKNITINFKTVHDSLNICILDDGIGYDYTLLAKESVGLGLKNILSRVEMLDGEIFIDTAIGKGTKYTITLPNK
ncbi:MAG: ATP-binding protein [Sediminibacterium sp.]|nr:ATP-binding protein [Sediminibacterium sp.]